MPYSWSTEENCLLSLSSRISLPVWWTSHHMSAYDTPFIHILAYLNAYWIELLSSGVTPTVWQLCKPSSSKGLICDIWCELSKSWSTLRIDFHCCSILSVLQKPFWWARVSCISHHQQEMGLQLMLFGPLMFISYHDQPLVKLTAIVGSTHKNLFNLYQQPQSQKLLFQLKEYQNRWNKVSCFTLRVLY